jgi:uncharacterized membrane protein (TIGR02234 family)
VTSRRELVASVVLCLVGSALVLLAVSRSWIAHSLPAAAPLPPKRFEVLGAHLAPGARALALVGLAAVAAVPATRRLGRVVVGLLLLAAGAGIAAVVVRALSDPDAAVRRAGPFVDVVVAPGQELGLWPYVAIVGAVLLVTAGLLVVVRGRSWTSMSARYDAPVAEPRGEASLWDALDRGEDPTDEAAHTGG